MSFFSVIVSFQSHVNRWQHTKQFKYHMLFTGFTGKAKLQKKEKKRKAYYLSQLLNMQNHINRFSRKPHFKPPVAHCPHTWWQSGQCPCPAALGPCLRFHLKHYLHGDCKFYMSFPWFLLPIQKHTDWLINIIIEDSYSTDSMCKALQNKERQENNATVLYKRIRMVLIVELTA